MQTTTRNRNGAKNPPPAAKPAVATAPVKGTFGKPKLSDAELLQRAKTNRAEQQKRLAARKLLAPVARAKGIVESVATRLTAAEKYLKRFDADGSVAEAMSSIGSHLVAIDTALSALPADYQPATGRTGPRGPRRVFAQGSPVYIKSKSYASLQGHFASQGPHTVIETTEDGEFVMLQGKRFAIGVNRKDLSPLSPAEQEAAAAEWKANHARE